MNSREILRWVEWIHRDRNIPKESIFQGIERALLTAARRYYGEDLPISVQVDRETGNVTLTIDGKPLTDADFKELEKRVFARIAINVLINEIKQHLADEIYRKFKEKQGRLVRGTITKRLDRRGNAFAPGAYGGYLEEGGFVRRGDLVVSVDQVETILPLREQIRGEDLREGQEVKAIVLEVERKGNNIRVILSRTHPQFVARLFELHVPEIQEGTVIIRSIAREPGERTKIAVESIDPNVEPVSACVGPSARRITAIRDELGGNERIDVITWSESIEKLTREALKPGKISQVIECPLLGRIIALVEADPNQPQESGGGEGGMFRPQSTPDGAGVAIGYRGVNVRTASMLIGYDIEVMTDAELTRKLEQMQQEFAEIPGMTQELLDALGAEGILNYHDLSCVEPEELLERAEGTLTLEECERIVKFAEVKSEELEALEEAKRKEEAEVRRREREQVHEQEGGTRRDSRAPRGASRGPRSHPKRPGR
ncbi:MAG: hypothetical protein KatS3mg114_0989 [Planctomycetaceae bacterium]|nr:MAG: hypothetical protein KatS3mg114_0989 [Planctomycetaceae bacterium]